MNVILFQWNKHIKTEKSSQPELQWICWKFLADCNCNNILTKNVDCDYRCLNPANDPWSGLGCNAGGQGIACRFCGFDNYPPCWKSNPHQFEKLSSHLICLFINLKAFCCFLGFTFNPNLVYFYFYFSVHLFRAPSI